jgi:hypothetical protein
MARRFEYDELPKKRFANPRKQTEALVRAKANRRDVEAVPPMAL